MKKISLAVAALVMTTSAFSQTLEERVEALELSRDLNWFKFGGSLESRYDYVNFQNKKAAAGTVPDTNAVKGQNNNQYFRLWANLNLEAKPNDRMTFFGRLSMAKYMNTFGSQGTNPGSQAFRGASEGAVATDTSALFLERAFINYSITNSLIFTMGRLPTIDGPNKHLALNQQIMGNYPTLAYSAILDGFALTKTFTLDNSSVLRAKAVYTPSQTINFNDPAVRPVNSAGKKLRSREDGFYSGLIEYEKTKGSFFDKNLTIFQYVRADQNLVDNYTTGVATDPISSDLRFAVDRFTLYSEFTRIADTSFDLAVQGMYSKVRSNGNLGIFPIGIQGWNTDKNKDTSYGHATVVTARYQLPFTALRRPKVGVEWFNSSKSAYLYDLANINPINMYQSTGANVYHAFWNQDFGDGLSANIGYFLRNQTRTYELAGILGKPQNVNRHDQNIYVSLLATF